MSPLNGCEDEGAVYWFHHSEAQRFTDFEDFFLGPADYDRRLLELEKQGRPGNGTPVDARQRRARSL